MIYLPGAPVAPLAPGTPRKTSNMHLLSSIDKNLMYLDIH